MAIVYYDQGATGNNDGTTPTDAYETMQAALTGAGAGGKILAKYTSQESYNNAHQTLTSPGTIDFPVLLVTVDFSDDSYVSNKAGTYNFRTDGVYDIRLIGFVDVYGLFISSGDDLIQTTSNSGWIFHDSKVAVDTAGSNGFLTVNNLQDSFIFFTLIDTVLDMGASGRFGNMLFLTAKFVGCEIVSTSSSVTMFQIGDRGLSLTFRDCDLSGWNGGDFITPDNGPIEVSFIRCKTPSGQVIFSGDLSRYNDYVILENCDSGDTQNMWQYWYYWGSIVTDTSNYRAGSSVEWSMKMVSNTKTKEVTRPLRHKLVSQCMDANPTVRVETISDFTHQNDEVWIEIEGPKASDGALGIIASSRMADMQSSPANNPASTEVWTETIADEVKQYIEKAFTGGQAGIYTVYVCLANSTEAKTVYVDEDVTVS